MSTSSASSPRERTFQYEDSLPSLILPPLEQTLQKYLESSKSSTLTIKSGFLYSAHLSFSDTQSAVTYSIFLQSMWDYV